MNLLSVAGLRLQAVAACLPPREIDNLSDCRRFFGDKTESVVGTLGIQKRRIADPGVTSADLCIRAAERAMEASGTTPDEIGAVVSLTFTPAMGLPGNAFLAQERLGLGADVLALDLHHACAGYPYALYVAGLVAANTGRKVLVLDGDVQSAAIAPDDRDLVPVLSDAGTATIIAAQSTAIDCDRLQSDARFAFLADGTGRGVLGMAGRGDALKMDGFGVFRFVAGKVTQFLKDFQAEAGAADFFVPHQANMYLVRQLARELGYGGEGNAFAQTGAVYGNSSSSTIPVALAAWGGEGDVLLAGFGAGLAAGAAKLRIDASCKRLLFDHDR